MTLTELRQRLETADAAGYGDLPVAVDCHNDEGYPHPIIGWQLEGGNRRYIMLVEDGGYVVGVPEKLEENEIEFYD